MGASGSGEIQGLSFIKPNDSLQAPRDWWFGFEALPKGARYPSPKPPNQSPIAVKGTDD